MVVQINPVYLYWQIPVIAWITHSKCFFFQLVHFVICVTICFFKVHSKKSLFLIETNWSQWELCTQICLMYFYCLCRVIHVNGSRAVCHLSGQLGKCFHNSFHTCLVSSAVGKQLDWRGHSGLYNVPEGGSGAAADGWSVSVRLLKGGNNLSWDMEKTCFFNVN